MKRSRVGGRSARIQSAVFDAVDLLVAEKGREGLSIPLVAERAGVTPSTIYRRWGGLTELLADATSRTLRPLADPRDTGSVRSDLDAWVEQYLDEMSSPVGRSILSDVLSAETDGAFARRCCVYTLDALRFMSERAVTRGEEGFDVDAMLDRLVAPILYRILFMETPPDLAYAHRLVREALNRP